MRIVEKALIRAGEGLREAFPIKKEKTETSSAGRTYGRGFLPKLLYGIKKTME